MLEPGELDAGEVWAGEVWAGEVRGAARLIHYYSPAIGPAMFRFRFASPRTKTGESNQGT